MLDIHVALTSTTATRRVGCCSGTALVVGTPNAMAAPCIYSAAFAIITAYSGGSTLPIDLPRALAALDEIPAAALAFCTDVNGEVFLPRSQRYYRARHCLHAGLHYCYQQT